MTSMIQLVLSYSILSDKWIAIAVKVVSHRTDYPTLEDQLDGQKNNKFTFHIRKI